MLKLILMMRLCQIMELLNRRPSPGRNVDNSVNPSVVVTELGLLSSVDAFLSLAATGPTLQKMFPSSLVRRAATAGIPAVSLR